MKYRWVYIGYVLIVMLIISSCGVESEGQGQSGGYKETKTMVLDILKSDEGVQAIKEAQQKRTAGNSSSDEGNNQGGAYQLLSANEQQSVQMAVKEVLTSENNASLLKQIMTDPKFAGDFAKAISKENKKLQKELIKDPEYQQSMMRLMKNPDYEKMLLEVMSTSQYRQQTMSAVQEAIQSPLFKMELLPLLQKIVSEELKPKESESGDQKQEEKSGSSEEENEDEQSDEGSGESESLSKTS